MLSNNVELLMTMRKLKGFSERQLASKLNISKSKVHRLKYVADLPMRFINLYSSGKVDLYTLTLLAKTKDAELKAAILSKEVSTYTQAIKLIGTKRFL